MTWVNGAIQICYMYLSSSWVCFHRWGTGARERAETYKASQELGSELACHHHHVLLAKACHRPTQKKMGHTFHFLVRETSKLMVKGVDTRGGMWVKNWDY